MVARAESGGTLSMATKLKSHSILLQVVIDGRVYIEPATDTDGMSVDHALDFMLAKIKERLPCAGGKPHVKE